ncbi:hypothetical protein YA0871_15690 [Pseudomonas paralactis]|uniref:Uncharacterized protein n=1 Tax=Pseudomonas paralactis TaxID=1615673 RepID=A0ABS0V1E3_9PSED|nr:hypothetical protein [Pseudomonas paralactis]MBI6634105.1 hypothetical protein [Pseudomonas paralactis]
MNTPASQKAPLEEFKAIVSDGTQKELFVANTVTIKKITDKDNAECWSIIAFQDVINKTTGSPEIFGIHLYISAAPSLKPRRLVAALPPPTAVKDSAIYFKVLDKIPDPDRDLDTQELYQSLDGSVVELEDADRIQGHFSFSALAPDRTPTHVMGHFDILNKGSHSI